jgi:DNA-3-methyladenine glycosylase
VLIRALEPTHGVELMRKRRGGKSGLELCSGPGKLTEALGIDLADNETDLCREPFLLTLPEGEPPEIVTGPRIGITKAVENPWRFCAAGNRNVSKPWPSRPRTRSGGGGA